MTLTWSSFVNGDEGLYKPKWWAVAFIKLPNYRGGSWSKITKFVSQFGWYEPSSPSTSYQRAPWLTFGALESAGNNFVVISCWRNFVFGFNSKSWLSKVLILISFFKKCNILTIYYTCLNSRIWPSWERRIWSSRQTIGVIWAPWSTL